MWRARVKTEVSAVQDLRAEHPPVYGATLRSGYLFWGYVRQVPSRARRFYRPRIQLTRRRCEQETLWKEAVTVTGEAKVLISHMSWPGSAIAGRTGKESERPRLDCRLLLPACLLVSQGKGETDGWNWNWNWNRSRAIAGKVTNARTKSSSLLLHSRPMDEQDTVQLALAPPIISVTPLATCTSKRDQRLALISSQDNKRARNIPILYSIDPAIQILQELSNVLLGHPTMAGYHG